MIGQGLSIFIQSSVGCSPAVIEMCIGLKLNSMTIVSDGLLVLSETMVSITSIVIKTCIVATESFCLVIVSDGLLILLKNVVSDSSVVVAVCMGFELDGLTIVIDSL